MSFTSSPLQALRYQTILQDDKTTPLYRQRPLEIDRFVANSATTKRSDDRWTGATGPAPGSAGRRQA